MGLMRLFIIKMKWKKMSSDKVTILYSNLIQIMSNKSRYIARILINDFDLNHYHSDDWWYFKIFFNSYSLIFCKFSMTI